VLKTFHSSLFLCLTAVSCWASSPPAFAAEPYPSRPITLIVPFGAGGITDLVARAAGKALSEQVKQAVIVENKPGAGGNIAAEYLKRAKPDGYTLMFSTIGVLAVNPHTGSRVGFDSAKDFSYISLVASTPHIIAVSASLPVQGLDQLIKMAADKSERVTFGTAGVGSSPYQGMQILQSAAKVKFLHVPFKSGVESVTSVVASQVDMTFEAGPVVMPFVKAGKLQALAVANDKRLASAPNVPSTTELGYPNIVSGSVSGLIGPAGLPDEVVATLNAAVSKGVQNPDFKALLLNQGTATESSTPEAFRKLVLSEDARWDKIMREEPSQQ
jgi:tripartite-type tricarboxylate transporter receptor subunit TctC